MTLFGTTFDGQQIATLVGLLATIALFLIIWKRDRSSVKAFRAWEARRKARREAEARATKHPSNDKSDGTGPWG